MAHHINKSSYTHLINRLNRFFPCYCRHKMYHMGKACDRPMDTCMTFNTSARSLIKYGHARAVGVEEGLDLLVQAVANV